MLTLEERKLILSRLPHGSGKKLAAQCGVTNVSVSMYFNGRINSKRIEKAVVVLASEIEKERKEILKKVGLL